MKQLLTEGDYNDGFNAGFAYRDNEVNKLKARIAKLEEGQGEPVGYKHQHFVQFIGVTRYQQLDAEHKANYLPFYLHAPRATTIETEAQQ